MPAPPTRRHPALNAFTATPCGQALGHITLPDGFTKSADNPIRPWSHIGGRGSLYRSNGCSEVVWDETR